MPKIKKGVAANPEPETDGLNVADDAKIELKASEKDIADARIVTEGERRFIASIKPTGKFEIVELTNGRTVLINKRLQIVSPVAVTEQEKSDLRRLRADMNMKDPEQKLINRKLADTPKFGTIIEDGSGKLDNPIVIPDAERGNLNK